MCLGAGLTRIIRLRTQRLAAIIDLEGVTTTREVITAGAGGAAAADPTLCLVLLLSRHLQAGYEYVSFPLLALKRTILRGSLITI